MTFCLLYLGHTNNSLFKMKELKGMNIEFGPWIQNPKIVALTYVLKVLSSES